MITSIERIETWQDFFSFEKDWTELTDRLPNLDIFSTHEWVAVWSRHFGVEGTPHILVLRQEGRLAGIAPFILMSQRWKGFPVRILRFPMDEKVDLWRTNFILRDETRHKIRAILECLVAERKDWDLMQLDGLRSDSPYLDLIEDIAKDLNLFVTPRRIIREALFLPIEGNWEEYLRAKSANFRRQLMRERKQLEAFGSISFSLYREPEEVMEAMPKVLSILFNRMGVQSQDEVSPGDRKLIDFTLDLASRFSRKNELEIRLLEINGLPVACTFCFVRDRIIYGILTKYDPAFSSGSPGRAIIIDLIQGAFKQCYREIDFLDSYEYMNRFTPHTRKYVGVTIYHSRLYSKIIRFGKQTLSPFRHKISGLLKSGGKDGI